MSTTHVKASHCPFLLLNVKRERCYWVFYSFWIDSNQNRIQFTVSAANALSTRPLIGLNYVLFHTFFIHAQLHTLPCRTTPKQSTIFWPPQTKDCVFLIEKKGITCLFYEHNLARPGIEPAVSNLSITNPTLRLRNYVLNRSNLR